MIPANAIVEIIKKSIEDDDYISKEKIILVDEIVFNKIQGDINVIQVDNSSIYYSEIDDVRVFYAFFSCRITIEASSKNGFQTCNGKGDIKDLIENDLGELVCSETSKVSIDKEK